MATEQHTSATGLAALPLGILFDIASHLGTTDIRQLNRVNRALHLSLTNYLHRHRYNAGLLALPNELILEIAQHLGEQKDRSALARTSQRFYPVVMGFIARYDVQHCASNLLHYAVRADLPSLARKILDLGGDVDTTGGGGWPASTSRPTPLMMAAFYGREDMVKLLLAAGASQYVGKQDTLDPWSNGAPCGDGGLLRTPLMLAIEKRHEDIALLLSADVDPFEIIKTSVGWPNSTALQLACMSKLPNLVRLYAERSSVCDRARPEIEHDLGVALNLVIRENSATRLPVEQELHEDVYQITLILLQHGANVDAPRPPRRALDFSNDTLQDLALRHPDPRVQALLGRPPPALAAGQEEAVHRYDSSGRAPDRSLPSANAWCSSLFAEGQPDTTLVEQEAKDIVATWADSAFEAASGPVMQSRLGLVLHLNQVSGPVTRKADRKKERNPPMIQDLQR
jgi:hypothetical protein